MVRIMRQVNLCSYFLLPLIGLSEHSFGESNFCDSFLDKEKDCIYVKIYSSVPLPEEVRFGELLTTKSGNLYLRYEFPELWKEDVAKFRRGMYSRMSNGAKECIVLNSGLQYQRRHNDQIFTDFRLLALNRSEVLREEWRRNLYDSNEHCLLDSDQDLELLDAPGDYMFFSEQIIGQEPLV